MLKKVILDEKLITVIILLNALTIFVQGFNVVNYNHILEYMDNIFTVVFIFELVLKFKYYGFNNFFKYSWNKFDFILIALAVPSLLQFTIGLKSIDLDFLLALRVLRVFKFFRFIKFIPKVDSIIKGAKNAIKSSMFIIFSFLIFNFSVSILSCYLFRNLSNEFFGNPILSFYSIFKIFTIEGWYEIPDALISQVDSATISFLIVLYFIILLFIGGIFGLSLVNSIFVESMIRESSDDIEDRLKNIELKLDKLLSETKDNKD